MLSVFLVSGVATTYGQRLQVTEIMADPTPGHGLPLTEYVEVYNAGNTPLPIAAIGLASGGRATSAGGGDTLAPGAFVVFVPDDSLATWLAAGVPAVGIELPGLTNTGDEVLLLWEGDTLQQIRYTLEWYRDTERDDGGYSLEYNGLGEVNCEGSWAASTDPSGGSPGRINTRAGVVLDAAPPEVISVLASDTGIDIQFSEAINGIVHGTFRVDGSYVEARQVTGTEYRIDVPIPNDYLGTLTVAPDFADCSGNLPSDTAYYQVYLPRPLRPGDVVINEILFDPVPGAQDYVEVRNDSPYPVAIGGLRIANTNYAADPVVIASPKLLPPRGYAVFTSDSAGLRDRYPAAVPNAIVGVDLPAFPNASGNVSLFDADGSVLDAFDYREDFHDPLLNPTEGVSLERLDANAPTQDAENWYSASTQSGYGTPTLPNSQARSFPYESATSFTLAAETFDPLGNGLADKLVVVYRADQPGTQARIRVIDLSGHTVRDLQPTALLGAAGTIHWDGRDDRGAPLPVGPYVLLIEAFHPEGWTERHRLLAILAG